MTRIWYSIPASRYVITEFTQMFFIYSNKIAKLKDLEQKIPTFLNCDNCGIYRSSNPNPTCDNVKLNDNALHQQICTHFKVDDLEEMDIIKQSKR